MLDIRGKVGGIPAWCGNVTRCGKELVYRIEAFYTNDDGFYALRCTRCADDYVWSTFEFAKPERYVLNLPVFGVKRSVADARYERRYGRRTG